MKNIEAMAKLTDILVSGNVEQNIEGIRECCKYMLKNELENVVVELINSICLNCRTNLVMKICEDVSVELDEKYDELYQ